MAFFILQALYYFLPAYVANMAPVVLSKLNVFPQPVDFGRRWNGKPLFGSHKTWGGLLYATAAGTAVFAVQQRLSAVPFFAQLSLADYAQQPLWLGFLLASGAILGDLGKSFVKRRLDKKPGERWFPWDQLDLVIGAFAFSSFVYVPPASVIAAIVLLTPVLHAATNHLGHWLGLKKVTW